VVRVVGYGQFGLDTFKFMSQWFISRRDFWVWTPNCRSSKTASGFLAAMRQHTPEKVRARAAKRLWKLECSRRELRDSKVTEGKSSLPVLDPEPALACEKGALFHGDSSSKLETVREIVPEKVRQPSARPSFAERMGAALVFETEAQNREIREAAEASRARLLKSNEDEKYETVTLPSGLQIKKLRTPGPKGTSSPTSYSRVVPEQHELTTVGPNSLVDIGPGRPGQGTSMYRKKLHFPVWRPPTPEDD